jgi:hypothetical protein
MKLVTYADKSPLVDDPAADALLAYMRRPPLAPTLQTPSSFTLWDRTATGWRQQFFSAKPRT